jgi:hypothetical protein
VLSGKVIGSLVGVAAIGLVAVVAARAWEHAPSRARVSRRPTVDAARPAHRGASGTTPRASSAPAADAMPRDPGEKTVRHTHALTEFLRDCWQREPGEPYAGQPIAKLGIVVPSAPEGDTPFDLCLAQVLLDDGPLAWEDDGWVVREGNGSELAGVWFPYSDRHTFWSVPAGGKTFRGLVRANKPICIRGSVARVGGQGYSDSWGAGVGLFLNKSGEQIGLHKPAFSKISVLMSGRQMPSLRLVLDDDGPSTGGGSRWCVNVPR